MGRGIKYFFPEVLSTVAGIQKVLNMCALWLVTELRPWASWPLSRADRVSGGIATSLGLDSVQRMLPEQSGGRAVPTHLCAHLQASLRGVFDPSSRLGWDRGAEILKSLLYNKAGSPSSDF
jgi:hypothetical protein